MHGFAFDETLYLNCKIHCLWSEVWVQYDHIEKNVYYFVVFSLFTLTVMHFTMKRNDIIDKISLMSSSYLKSRNSQPL